MNGDGEIKNFLQLKRNLKKDCSAFTTKKVALLGDTATQFLSTAIKGAGFEYSLNIEVYEADFNQIERQVFDKSSELYLFKPDIVIVFYSTHKLLNKYNKTNIEGRLKFAEEHMDLIRNINYAISENLKAKTIFYNYNEIDDSVFGNYANKQASSFLFQIRKLNYELMLFVSGNTDAFINDIATLQNKLGKQSFFQPSIYINSEMVLSIDVLPAVAYKTLDTIAALTGKFKKCLILDLDNTLWGGVIGDDGIDNIQIGNLGIGKAFTEFQYWVKKLKDRGIILAVCSKNTESVAKEPFEKHPDMVLRLEDIAVFVANWENKADNIRKIQKILNIGFDSMVFLDDNPFERSLVKENIPDITIPELPEDPADYLEFLYTQNLFETVSFSAEDANRTRQYQVEAQRLEWQKSFVNEAEFLKNLNMSSVVESFNKFNTPRVAQLSQRSNQFNLRTVRYTESDIESLAANDQYFTFSFTLSDKFGDNGLICVVILRKEESKTLFIETWLMSCRVLKRGMEQFTLNTIAGFARQNGFTCLKGEYLPTPKNEMVKDHYEKLGFEPDGKYWVLDTGKFGGFNCHISYENLVNQTV